MKKNRTHLSALFCSICVVLCGCNASREDIPESGSLTLIPGTGIVGYVEIGMKYSDIPVHLRKREHAVRLLDGRKLISFEIVEWGVDITMIKNEPLGLITFYTDEYHPPRLAPELEKISKGFSADPFKGSVAGGVTFSNGPVHKDEIIQKFGAVTQVAVNSYGSVTNPSIPFILQCPEGVEVINYPSGIEFSLKTNIVESVRIFRPASDRF